VLFGAAHDASRARRREPVRGQCGAGGRTDLNGRRAEPVPQVHVGVGETGRDRVAVASERDRRVRGNDPSDVNGGGEHGGGQRDERLGVAERADGRGCAGGGAALAGVAGAGEEAVQRQLRLLRAGRGRRSPPSSAHIADRGLNRALAVPPPRWARLHDRAVVLRDWGEGRLHVPGAGHDHGSEPVSAPHPGGAAQAAHHRVHRLHEVRLVEGLGQHTTRAGRVRQCSEQHVRGAAPRRSAPFEPVPLDLLARRVLDLDGVAALHAPACLAVRPQPTLADLAHEAGVAPLVTERGDLDEQRRRPKMWVIAEPGPDVALEVGQRVRHRGHPGARLTVAVQVRADRLAVTLQMAGDGRDRPAPLP
jgi:hypothetical protein